MELQIPKVIECESRILVGASARNTLINDRTRDLWQSFMPKRNELSLISPNLYAVQVYDEIPDFTEVDPAAGFTIWAAVEASDRHPLPAGLDLLEIAAGTYVVFTHRGHVRDFFQTLNTIFHHWLPRSPYVLDHRPHVTVMGEKYQPTSDDSEETIWIPVK